MPVPVAEGWGRVSVVKSSATNAALVVWLLQSCLSSLLSHLSMLLRQKETDGSETRVACLCDHLRNSPCRPERPTFGLPAPGWLCCSEDQNGRQCQGPTLPSEPLPCVDTCWGCTCGHCFSLACVPQIARIITTGYSHCVPFLSLSRCSQQEGLMLVSFTDYVFYRILYDSCHELFLHFKFLFPSCSCYFEVYAHQTYFIPSV